MQKWRELLVFILFAKPNFTLVFFLYSGENEVFRVTLLTAVGNCMCDRL